VWFVASLLVLQLVEGLQFAVRQDHHQQALNSSMPVDSGMGLHLLTKRSAVRQHLVQVAIDSPPDRFD